MDVSRATAVNTMEDGGDAASEKQQSTVTTSTTITTTMGTSPPLTLEDFPLELLALIADFLFCQSAPYLGLDHMARMRAASRRLRDGVSVSRQWVVLEELVAMKSKLLVHNNRGQFRSRDVLQEAAVAGSLRTLRRLDVANLEGSKLLMPLCQGGHEECLKYLCDSLPTSECYVENYTLYNIRGAAIGLCRNVGVLHTLLEKFPLPISIPMSAKVSLLNRACGLSSGSELIKYMNGHNFGRISLTTVREYGLKGILCKIHHSDVISQLYRLCPALFGPRSKSRLLRYACRRGHLSSVQYLCEKIGIAVRDVRRCRNAALRLAVEGEHVPIITYLRQFSGLTKEDATAALLSVVAEGSVESLRALREGFKLTAADIRRADRDGSVNAVLQQCLKSETPWDMMYDVWTWGMTADDARKQDNELLRNVVRTGNADLVRLLRVAFHLTAEDARARYNDCLREACAAGNMPVVVALHEFGLTADDARVMANRPLLNAATTGSLELVKYLRTGFGLSADDARQNRKVFEAACQHGHVDIARYLLSWGVSATAACAGNNAILRELNPKTYPIIECS